MAVDPDLLREELRRMRELIATDPKVFAHFDTDGNGVIDGDEWDRVRQLVIRRLERQEQEAEESARLRDEYARELPTPTPAADPTGPGERDFSNLELAFDPRAQPRDTVTADIYERDLHARVAPSSRVRVGEDHTLGGFDELILEQMGGVKQMFGSMFRREYDIKTPDGEVVGHVAQRQNEMVENLTVVSVFDLPDIDFVVDDYVADEQFRMRRSRGFSDNSITVTDPRGRIVATTSWSLSFVRRKYEIRVPSEGISYYVRRRMFRPWTYDALDPFEEPIGDLQRGWNGFGFLAGANLFHIAIDEAISSATMWGFLAAALLADLDSEPNSRGSFLSG